MVPIQLDPKGSRIALVGEGGEALGRLRFLRSHGAEPEAIFAPAPAPELVREAGALLRRHWPEAADLSGFHLVLAGDLAPEQAQALSHLAQKARLLLNIEDRPALSNVHIPATVRRGDLLLTASTGGRAPGLSRRLAGWLAQSFGPEWEGRLDEIAARRGALRAAGLSGSGLARRMDSLLDEKGWLS